MLGNLAVSGNFLRLDLDALVLLQHPWNSNEGREIGVLQLLLGCISLGSGELVLVQDQDLVENRIGH